jgi:hypothetical protein
MTETTAAWAFGFPIHVENPVPANDAVKPICPKLKQCCIPT